MMQGRRSVLVYVRTCAYCMHVFEARGVNHEQAMENLERTMDTHYRECDKVPGWMRPYYEGSGAR